MAPFAHCSPLPFLLVVSVSTSHLSFALCVTLSSVSDSLGLHSFLPINNYPSFPLSPSLSLSPSLCSCHFLPLSPSLGLPLLPPQFFQMCPCLSFMPRISPPPSSSSLRMSSPPSSRPPVHLCVSTSGSLSLPLPAPNLLAVLLPAVASPPSGRCAEGASPSVSGRCHQAKLTLSPGLQGS